jgi:hypothetical protein
VICSDHKSEQTILGWMEDEEGSDVDILNDNDSISEVGAVDTFILHYSLKIKYLI